MYNVQVLILAGGRGKRINAKDKPKVLFPLLKKPMILYSLKAVEKAGFKKPILVIGFKGELVKKLLKNRVKYVWQKSQLGTGHAVLKAKEALKNTKSVLIIYGDMPLWKPETFKKLIKTHQKTKAVLSLVTVILENPLFFKYGHILRDKNNNILGIIEEKDATEKQKQIKECNPGCYLIKTKWLFENLSKIKKSSVSGEYYLTDILGLAVSQNRKISKLVFHGFQPIKINVLKIEDFKQVVGINTSEQLKLAEKVLEERSGV